MQHQSNEKVLKVPFKTLFRCNVQHKFVFYIVSHVTYFAAKKFVKVVAIFLPLSVHVHTDTILHRKMHVRTF